MPSTFLTIEGLGPMGDGIASAPLCRGRIFVERALPGDQLQAYVRRDEQGISRGEIEAIVEPSPYRQPPPCRHYERCGGCTMQHLDERFYREWKTGLVQEALERQGLRPREWKETLFLGEGNRRRATFATVRDRGRVILGYYRRRSREITDVTSCLVADPRLLQVRDLLRDLVGPMLIERQPVDIFLQIVGDAVDMVVNGPLGSEEAVLSTMEKILASTPIVRIGWRASADDEVTPVVQKGPFKTTFGSLTVTLPAAAFLQPTREGEAALVGAVMAALPPEGKFADLFSGSGTFTGPMLERGPVDAFEAVGSAVSALSKAAGDRPLRVYRRDLYRRPLTREEIRRYDAIVFDPPRAGCGEQATEMATAKTRTLVGVSCNPATFARDARILVDGGYWLQSVQAIDQFRWSHHVEVVGVFTKKKRG